MQRGNLVIYDLEGTIVAQTGEADGDLLPHVYPVGIPYIEIPFGTMAIQKLISIDVSETPHQPIFEAIVIESAEEKIARLEAELALLKTR